MTTLYALIFIAISALAHDLLIFDEFQYTFNLLDPNDWDQHQLTNDYSSTLDATDLRRRRLTEEYLQTSSDLLSSTNTDHASKCTDVIPVLFKQLCVHWDAHTGFRYQYQAPGDTAAHLLDTNWYYKSKEDKISDAKNADKNYADLLDLNDIYLGDDSAWNEINYASKVSSFSLNNAASRNHFLRNYVKGSIKHCRHRPYLQECTEFHLPSKTLTVKLKTARERRELDDEDMEEYKAEEKHAREIPSNMYTGFSANAMDDIDMDYEGYYDGYYYNYNEMVMGDIEDDMPYDFEGEFEYGDARGYHNWAADMMRWEEFDCNCNDNEQHRRRGLESMYDEYGDYTYLFHDHELDFENDMDWNEISKQGGMKCSIAIPGLSHKLCVDLTVSNKDAQIKFNAANNDDIDYGYYDMYGYDLYYYNIDHLYEHGSHQHAITNDAREDFYDFDEDTDKGYTRNAKTNNYYHYGSNKDTDDDVDNDGNVKDDAANYDYDYYHTHSDHLDDDKSLNSDFDKDMYDRKTAEDDYDHVDNENKQYPDMYKKFKDQQYDAQDRAELAQLSGPPQNNPMTGINNPYNMMNPLQQLQQQMYPGMSGGAQSPQMGATRRRLTGMNTDYLLGIGGMNSGYYDETFYDELIDAAQQRLDSSNEAFVNSLREEFDNYALNFQDDNAWDSITHIHDVDKNPWIKKCTSSQTTQICATTDPTHKSLKLNLKVGKYKFHRSFRPWESKAREDMNNMYSDTSKKSSNTMDQMQNMDAMDTNMDEWSVDAEVIDVDDDEWNNNVLWTNVKEIPLKSKLLHKKIIRKCRARTFCLCAYLDQRFDNNQKHKCISNRDHKQLLPHYKLLNIMDKFMGAPLRHGIMGHNNVHLQFQYHPSIVHLHIMGRYPFFHRHHHLHRYKVPWFKYKRYQHLRPHKRPEWCPRWMWRELQGHLKKPPGFEHNKAQRTEPGKTSIAAGKLDETDYYDYDGAMVDEMDAMDNDEEFFEDELPFLGPLIRSGLELTTNALKNARKVLPEVLKQRVGPSGDITQALNARSPIHLGHAGPELRGGLNNRNDYMTNKYLSSVHRARMEDDNEYYYDNYDDDDYYDDEDYYDEDYYDNDGDILKNARKMYAFRRNGMNIGNNGMRGMHGYNYNNGYMGMNAAPAANLIRAFQGIRGNEIQRMHQYDQSKAFSNNRVLHIGRRRMPNYNYYYEEDEDEEDNDIYMEEDETEAEEEEDIIDDWFDEETGMNWVILLDEFKDEMGEFNANDLDMEWDKVKKDIITSSGNTIHRRCMNIFGKNVCLCEFLDFINAQSASHLCKPKPIIKLKPKAPGVIIKPKPLKTVITPKPKSVIASKRPKIIAAKPKNVIESKKIGTKPALKPKNVIASKPSKVTTKVPKGISPKPRKVTTKVPKGIAPKPQKVITQNTIDAELRRLNRAQEAKQMLKGELKAEKAAILKKKLASIRNQYKTEKVRKNMIAKKKLAETLEKKDEKLGAEPVYKNREKLKLINGKTLGAQTIKKMERAQEEKKKIIQKKKKDKMEAKKVLKKAATNILMAKAKQIRKEVKGQTPIHRPLWLPHYFWHWLHRAPHFHVLRHKRRVPWKPNMNGVMNRAMDMDDEDYVYDDEEEYYGWDDEDEEASMEYTGYDARVDDWNEDEGYTGYGAEEADEYDDDGYTAHMDEYNEYYDDEDEYSEGYDAFEEDNVYNDDYEGGLYDWIDEDEYGEGYDVLEEENEYYDDDEGERYDWIDEEEFGDNSNAYDEAEDDVYDIYSGWNDANEDDNDYYNDYEVEDEYNMNYLQNGNDFTTMNGDAGEYGGSFLWLIGFMSFVLFCIFAFCISIGVQRRKRKLRRQKAENIYLQQALEMTESESESESDQDIIE